LRTGRITSGNRSGGDKRRLRAAKNRNRLRLCAVLSPPHFGSPASAKAG